MAISSEVESAISAVAEDDEETAMIDNIVVDALVSMSGGSGVVNVTDRPVQSGIEITDAATEKPAPLVMEIVFSNPEVTLKSLLLGEDGEKYEEKRVALEKIKSDKKIITVQTHDRLHESMLLVSIDENEYANENFDVFQATVVFKKLKTVDLGVEAGKTEDAISAAKAAVGGL